MNEENRSRLLESTEQLRTLNKEAEKMYVEKVRSDQDYEADFFGVVKPFADKVDAIRKEWLPLAQQFVQEEKPLHLHPNQLQQTEENLEIVAIKSFFKETGKKRQMETFKSVEYVLQQLYTALHDK
ncbi:YppE family protein [Alkalihalobacillus sp. MEB130]|uniref:YppE family protein n=1 Tax=Alkalihalobacillus sp. MEB130 TaxID=2976704 RepID=UPI0028DD6C1A|nr:YppE family protein [Alkalihalobacillus sp. MEB130]MDT8859962.1 YppE family protein [Alkalihalobacillus sp. MEB130]